MRLSSCIALAAITLASGAFAQSVIQPLGGWSIMVVYGKAQMEDGSPPPKPVTIEETCTDGLSPGNLGNSDKLGRFTWKLDIDPAAVRRCFLKAVLQGYTSTRVEMPNFNVFSDPHLPPIVLTQSGSNSDIDVLSADVKVPGAAQFAWDRAQKAIGTNRLADAEKELTAAVKNAPKFARGWDALAMVLENENKPAEAWKDYRQAIEVDPKLLGAYVPLARLSVQIKEWEEADKVTTALIQQDPSGRYAEARLLQSMARFQLKNYDGALTGATEAVRLDAKLHKMPSAEYMIAISLDAKNDRAGARQHLTQYLALLPPNSTNAEAVRRMIDTLDKAPETSTGGLLPPPQEFVGVADVQATGLPGEAWVPGGRKALAAVAGLKDVSSYDQFFTEYSRTLAREMTVGTSQGIPQYLETVRAYMAAVSELLPLGEKKGDDTTITLSLATEGQRQTTERVLASLGWKLVGKDQSYTVQPGDQPADGPRQRIPRLFGIDEVSMQQALESGKSFSFVIPSENVRVVGGNDWASILRDLPQIPGGIAAAFTLDVRVAKTYAGLGSMTPDAASALIRTVGVRNLVLRFSEMLVRYGESFAVTKTGVAVPGGAAAEPIWQKLTGANPHEPGAFLRALIEKNEGRLAAFYYAVWSADEAHQRYLLKSEARADRFYTWYRDSEEFKVGLVRHVPGWRTELLHKLPLDGEGNTAFPGGRAAWTKATSPEDEALLSMKTLEALVPISALEQRRKSPLDAASATLVAEHFTQWKSLFPYFEKLPALGSREFASLAAFEAAVGKQPSARQNVLLGEWYSMVELIARGVAAGSLDGPASARAFQRTCDGLLKDDSSAEALATLREIAGGENLTQAVASNLLRLSPEKTNAFQRVLELQSVPSVDPKAPKLDPAQAVAELSGFVYAAAMNPDALLISEDRQLLSRHQFVPPEAADKLPFTFRPAALVGSNAPPGSFVQGGFVNFDEVVRELADGGRSVPPIALNKSASTQQSQAGKQGSPVAGAAADLAAPDAVFRANGRLVEAYATVTDARGRYIDDLTQEQFSLIDQQKAQPLVAFESHATPVSVALLLDTTGSMSLALPALKSAALKLIGDLRPVDSVAVYSFNRRVTELQPFTTDMGQAKRAVLSATALGETALYDALARVARDLSGRPGKKVIVVFTDGNDNSSTLMTDTAILRVKATGVPVHTIAEGEALTAPAYLKQLADLSKATGGESFAIKDSSEIGAVFEKVSEDLAHGYLLVFQPETADDHNWRAISVQVRGVKGSKVRAREGYYPE